MSRLHKKINLSLAKKMEIMFLVFILYGWYKNGILPFYHGFYTFSHVILVLLYPILGFGIGGVLDFLFPGHAMFDAKFYGLLFSLMVPISTPIWLFLLFLMLLLFFYIFVVKRKDLDFHFVVFGHLALVLVLYFFNQYYYTNLLESSNQFVYSFLDSLFGHQVGGLFISNSFLLLVGFFFLVFDSYYKSEISLYSYGIYFLSLLEYSVFIGDMSFFLNHFCSSMIFFALVFLAPFPMFSPYSMKRKTFYGGMIGLLILPCSLWINFYEGVYLAIFIINILLLILNLIQNRLRK